MPPLSPHRFNASLLLEGILEDTILEGTLAVKWAEIDAHICSSGGLQGCPSQSKGSNAQIREHKMCDHRSQLLPELSCGSAVFLNVSEQGYVAFDGLTHHLLRKFALRWASGSTLFDEQIDPRALYLRDLGGCPTRVSGCNQSERLGIYCHQRAVSRRNKVRWSGQEWVEQLDCVRTPLLEDWFGVRQPLQKALPGGEANRRILSRHYWNAREPGARFQGLDKLCEAPAPVVDNLLQQGTPSPQPLTVALHLRLGDRMDNDEYLMAQLADFHPLVLLVAELKLQLQPSHDLRAQLMSDSPAATLEQVLCSMLNFSVSARRSVAPADGTPAHELLQLSGGRLPTSLWLDVPAAPNCLHAIHCMAAADVLLRSNQSDHTAELAGFVSRGHALRYDHTDPNRMTAEQLASSLIRGGAPVLGSQ